MAASRESRLGFMEDLEITCPVCGEVSVVLAEDMETLEVGDVLECEACGPFWRWSPWIPSRWR